MRKSAIVLATLIVGLGSGLSLAHAQDWKETLKWGDGPEVHWKATPAPACNGSNVDLKFVNRSKSGAAAQLDGITFSCQNGTEFTSPSRTLGLVSSGSSAVADTILCACAEQGPVTELLSIDLDFMREGPGEELLTSGCTYTGSFSRGKRSGTGKLTCPTGYTLEGTFSNDEPNGHAVETLPSGQVYDGIFLNGIREGRGKMSYINGTVYDGAFANGLRNGTGALRYPDGAEYVGEWIDDKRIGYGTYTPADQTWTYAGHWVDDRRTGDGKLTYTDGSYTYEGPFVDDLPHGEGSVTFADGAQFRGIFVNGAQNGPGTLSYVDGRTIMGSFKDLRPHGKAVDTGAQLTFDGDWIEGQLHGHVVMTSTTGARFEGQYLNGKRNGDGMETNSDGSRRQCMFVDDVGQEPCKHWTAEGKPIVYRNKR